MTYLIKTTRNNMLNIPAVKYVKAEGGEAMPVYWHLHALLLFNKRVGSRKGDDIHTWVLGKDTPVKGHYLQARSVENVAKYIMKGGVFVGINCDAERWFGRISRFIRIG